MLIDISVTSSQMQPSVKVSGSNYLNFQIVITNICKKIIFHLENAKNTWKRFVLTKKIW